MSSKSKKNSLKNIMDGDKKATHDVQVPSVKEEESVPIKEETLSDTLDFIREKKYYYINREKILEKYRSRPDVIQKREEREKKKALREAEMEFKRIEREQKRKSIEEALRLMNDTKAAVKKAVGRGD
jgi:hypothetical protein